MAITATRVNVLNSAATQIVPAGVGATSVMVQNGGPNSISIGAAGVTTTTGYIMPTATQAVFTPGRNTALFAIALTADQTSPTNTSVLYTSLD
jgi:hypothetical protein